jgi:hypothetical protein
MKYILLILWVITPLSLSIAWDGYDYEKGGYIEIEKGNLVRPGKEIEIYDYSDGEYKNVEVESVNSDEVEVYDNETGESRTFEME